MFRGCTSLAFATAQSADYPYEYRIPTNGEGTEANNALLNMFTETGGTFTGTPEINTTLFAASTPVPVGGSKLTLSVGGGGNQISWTASLNEEGLLSQKLTDKVFTYDELTTFKLYLSQTIDGETFELETTPSNIVNLDGSYLVYFSDVSDNFILVNGGNATEEQGSGLYVHVVTPSESEALLGVSFTLTWEGTPVPDSVTDTTATVNFSCKDLLYTDSVYRIQAWVYEPSGWSYNGVEMPESPVVDGCPYAVMYKSNNSYDLFLSAQKLYVNEGKTATYVCEAGDFVFYSEYISKSKQWHYINTYPFSKDELHSRFSLANLCWSNYDILNTDGSVYLAASEPVPAGLDVTQPATWTSDLFAGPSHSESHTFTGLTPATEYGIYAVIWSETDGAATEHNATATFTTLEGEAPTVTIQFGAVNITDTGFTAVIEASGLDDATAYTAEIVVYNTATSAVAAEAVRSFTGNYTMAIDFAGLTPETDYTVAVDVYPTDTGKVVARGEFPVATGQEEPKTSWRDSFLLGFASGLGCTAATKTDADHNAWMQGYLVGDALRSAITTQQGFRYEVPDLQATVRMVAECFTESGDTLLFNAHNGSMILGVSTQNEATFTDRTDVTKYLIPIPAEASKVTVETSDPKVTLAQFVGVNGSGGNYTKVFSSAREAVYSYEFPKGAAQYMAIDLIYEDKGAVTVPWDYVLADTTVTFT